MDTNKINNISNKIIKYASVFFAIFTIFLFAFFIVGELILPDERDPLSQGFGFYNDGWVYVHEDGTTEPIEIPNDFDSTRGEWVAISNTLPEDLVKVRCICMQSVWQDVRIYVGDELRVSYDTSNSRFFGSNSTLRYIFAEVFPQDAGKTITIMTKTNTAYSGSFRTIYIGDTSSIWQYFFTNYGYKTILELVMLIISIICIFICFFLRFVYHKHFPLIYLSLGVFFCSVWLLSEMKFRQLFFSNVSTLSSVTFLALMAIPYPFLIFMNETQNGRYRVWHALSLVYASIVTVTSTTLQIFNIADFRNTLTLIHSALIVGIITVIATIVADIIKKKVHEYYLVAFGLLGIIVGAIAEILYFYQYPGTTLGTYLALGLMFLLVMSAFKAAQDALTAEHSKQKAILANEAKAKFLANMSHEIRTPINTVIGMNEMILRENKDENIMKYADNIQAASKMLLGLVNDVLDFSKIESGQLELIEDSYRLDTLLMDELNLLESRAKKKNLNIILDADSSLPRQLWGDELRIKQILTNILTNAVKYTNEGSISIKAVGSYIDSDNISLSISVIDTGTGIKPENLSQLFETFTRLEESKNRNIEGTGLGLNIAKSLADLMHGVIKVESEYGKGSAFTVEIPQKVMDKTPIGNINNSSEYVVDRETINKEVFTAPDANVLVVDDNDMNLAVIRGLLKRTKVHVDTASGGLEALKLTESNRYDIILMDHMMPEPDGVATLNMLREDTNNPNRNTVVIVLTANAIAGCYETYINQGFNDYLAKPVEPRRLEQTLAKYLSGKLQ